MPRLDKTRANATSAKGNAIRLSKAHATAKHPEIELCRAAWGAWIDLTLVRGKWLAKVRYGIEPGR